MRNGQDKYRLLTVCPFRDGFTGKGRRATVRGIHLTEWRVDEVAAAPWQGQAVVSSGAWIRAWIKDKKELRV